VPGGHQVDGGIGGDECHPLADDQWVRRRHHLVDVVGAGQLDPFVADALSWDPVVLQGGLKGPDAVGTLS
jgi:hypothetical protein